MNQNDHNPTLAPIPKIGFVSLGCPKALVDSERIITQLRLDGYELAADYNGAEAVIVNTCGFIDSAKAESLDAISEAMAANGKVVVTGCLGVEKEEIYAEFPNLLAVTGPQQYEQVVQAIRQHVPPPESTTQNFAQLIPEQGIKLTPRHYAYLKISEGCNHRCSFCIIPSMRGDLVSRPIDKVIAEANALFRGGVKELLVVSQDTSAYGVDLKYAEYQWRDKTYQTRFYDLAATLSELAQEYGAWVRLHYVYPYPHVDKIVPLMSDTKNTGLLPYLDIPFQHGSPKILRAMKRPGNIDGVLERIQQWREICPDLTIRSTFIVGFPGETEEDFQMLLDFIETAKIDNAGCFEYSPVEGASANKLADPVDDATKKDRYHRFMMLQQEISLEQKQTKVGLTLPVIIDEIGEDIILGRSPGDAPEIDGQVFIDLPESIDFSIGDIIPVHITEAEHYDLFGMVAE
jgi:ribosomal protein S12 methylthiotransferase